MDLTNTCSGGFSGFSCPYPIDPAIVTAVDIAGGRMDPGKLERVDE